MRHTSRNLFLLVLMGYSLTALPLNPELATLDLSRFSYENALRNQANQGLITYAYVLNSSQKPLVNPGAVDFLIRAEGGKKPKWSEAPALSLEVVSAGGDTVKTLNGEAFAEVLSAGAGFNPYEIRYTLNLSQQALGLSGGSYTLRISGTDPDLEAIPPLEVPIQYLSQMAYRPAAAAPDPGKQMVISYFSDASGRFSVPVSREIPKSGKQFRTAVNQLLTPPPAVLGLKGTVLVPRVSSIQYTNGLVSCVLGSPVPPELYTDPVLAATAEKTLTESIAAIESPYRISRIKYSWSGVDSVPGWPVEEKNVTASPKAWLGLTGNDSQVLLVPVDASATTPQALFDSLKTGQEGLIATIPGQAVLREARMEGDILVLVMAEGFQGLFSDAPDQAALLIDSLGHSMTTLPGVKALRLQEEGTVIQSLAGTPVPAPLTPAPFVNPEKAFLP